MQQVVVAGAIIQCSHGGTARLPKGDNRLEISNKPAVTAGQETGVSFALGAPTTVVPCPHLTPPPAARSSPCSATQAAQKGISTLLVIGNAGVLLRNASGQATNADDPAAKWSVADAGQTLLSVDH
jgi:hypothetical protein